MVEEAATDIIAREQQRDNPEPWRQPDFIAKIVRLQRQRQIATATNAHERQFYDRSPVCSYALSQWLGYAPSSALLEEMERIGRERIYQRQVFFIDNLGFCEPTEARRISFAESLEFEQVHLETYLSFGYDCIHIPAQSIAERVSRIIARC